jgi:hypothetical protein
MLQVNSLDEFITRFQVDGVMWKADRLLSNLENSILRNDRCKEIANTLALIPETELVQRDDYVQRICKEHNIKTKTLERYIADALVIVGKKEKGKKPKAKKNKIRRLDGDAKKFPFFVEVVKKTKNGQSEFDSVKIDKVKFVRLLSHFGFSRYDANHTTDDDKFNFIMLKDNVIQSVTRNRIIDFIEKFIQHEYDFEAAGYSHVDDEILMNALYDQNRTIFSKDLFARVRTEEPILINMDKQGTTYFYFKNGFVEVTKNGYELKPYEEMTGSVWDKQMLERNFTLKKPTIDLSGTGWLGSVPDPKSGTAQHVMPAGFFADFCWHVASQNNERFKALCTIIGYLTHDYYEYTLKSAEFTDSTLSEASEGRTGKTLLMKMIGKMRSYCEIPGKDFDPNDKNKYQTVQLGTQLIHLNDVNSKGRNKFDFERMFNDITEGLEVNAKYMAPFRIFCKIAISTNKSLNIEGASMRARIVEFEMSPYFGENRKVDDYYGHWFGRDWDESEWCKFDNFMCFCAMTFHEFGLLEPAVMNLNERKLLDHTNSDFLDFMNSITESLETRGIPWENYTAPVKTDFVSSLKLHEFEFEKRAMYDRMRDQYPDLKKDWFTMSCLRKWLLKFSELRMSVKTPRERKSDGKSFIQFIPETKKPL